MEEMNLIASANVSSPIAEAFKTIRTSIQFSQIDGKPLKSILVVSPTPNEGKSTVVANLAVVMAQSGKNVVVLDCDLRNPTQHKIWNLAKRGLSDCFAMDASLDDVMQETSVDNLWAVASGKGVINPSELLASEKMTHILAELSDRFDYVLVDVPPVLPVTDATIMSNKVDGVVVVLESGKDKPQAYMDTLERLEQSNASILGAVLNKIDVNSSRYGYGSDYYYYYGENGEKERRRHRH